MYIYPPRSDIESLLTSLGNYVNAAIWTACEPSMGVVSACLPSLRPLFKRIFRGTYRGPTFRSRSGKSLRDYGSGSSARHAWTSSKNETDDTKNFSRLEEAPDERHASWGHNVEVQGGRQGRHGGDDDISLVEMHMPIKRIKVKTEVTLISTERLEYRDQLF